MTEEKTTDGAASALTDGLWRDNCEICHGEMGGVKGNENLIDGKRVCDYCDSPMRSNA